MTALRTRDVVGRVRDLLGRHEVAAPALLHGSHALGIGNQGSDIDVYVLTDQAVALRDPAKTIHVESIDPTSLTIDALVDTLMSAKFDVNHPSLRIQSAVVLQDDPMATAQGLVNRFRSQVVPIDVLRKCWIDGFSNLHDARSSLEAGQLESAEIGLRLAAHGFAKVSLLAANVHYVMPKWHAELVPRFTPDGEAFLLTSGIGSHVSLHDRLDRATAWAKALRLQFLGGDK